jgi:hypothetical protein
VFNCSTYNTRMINMFVAPLSPTGSPPFALFWELMAAFSAHPGLPLAHVTVFLWGRRVSCQTRPDFEPLSSTNQHAFRSTVSQPCEEGFPPCWHLEPITDLDQDSLRDQP